MSLDGLPPAHLRVLLDGTPVFERYGLLLAGGYAFRAHEIVHRPSQDLDFATGDATPLPEIAANVQLAFQRAGYGVRLAEAASHRYARLVLRLPGSDEELEFHMTSNQRTRHDVPPWSRNRADKVCHCRLHGGESMHSQIHP